jgi:hypothetical protein
MKRGKGKGQKWKRKRKTENSGRENLTQKDKINAKSAKKTKRLREK